MEGENWEDLFAVVRGSISYPKYPTTAAVRDPFSSLPPPHYQDTDLLHCYPDLCSTRTALQEMEELCKPFLPPQPPPHYHTKPISPSPQPFFLGQTEPTPLSQTVRSKRRKNQQKRVVCQVPADGLSSDMWAWRKYGQKPIKGSPFPRGYYRCSSSKGCLARKQVERSRKDPTTFIITYTAEHNHPIPTHRNSLAGSTRQKNSSSISVSKFVNQKKCGDDGKVVPSSGSDVTEEEKKGDGEEQVEQEGVKMEEEEEDVEEETGMIMMREMEMFVDEDVMFVGFDEIEDSMDFFYEKKR